MTTYVIQGAAEPSHQTRKHGADVVVDDTRVVVRSLTPQTFSVQQSTHAHRLHAVAHGDSVYVQLHGRACRIDRVDPDSDEFPFERRSASDKTPAIDQERHRQAGSCKIASRIPPRDR